MNQCSWCGVEITPQMLERAVRIKSKRIVLIDGTAHLLHVESQKEMNQEEAVNDGTE